ncbi:2TM domain-containing protein [Psychroserpens sp.]|uniref:2TM domain-containing protein n=1 Tax=Psychroserpens sp. TaxID=2020870 RepID=UPI001B13C1B6|nr:2TM domain-containing protein [Psychroserpens sp.]MBO6606994.1 2TM domain-containing protein [Psychroserpens sp.]MBO6630535.1 2TM domain-containing protein [Psychroserpens sp.]MBO6654140.1 2TM domain-containing protein [Psychroserpens sp.]MBO6682574.1 2TM domain-containing protein [Psychroserpens sp.]MBO6750766.1 2TM domain-containing protein [Psychroserpens sp.]
MKEFTEDYKYERAKSKMQNLKAFYIHFTVYVIVNTIISIAKVIRNVNNGETFNEAIFDFATIGLWTIWGVGIAFHAFSVYGLDFFLGKNWETKQLEKYMNQDDR